MDAVLNVALPVFAIILAGAAAGRARILGPASSEALNAFVYWIALPPLLFLAMAGSPVQQVLHLPFIGAFLGGALAVWGLAAAAGRLVQRAPPGVLTMQGMTAGFANTGYMGIPLFVAAFGEAGLPPATLATVVMSAVGIGIAVVGLELSAGERRGLGRAMRDVGRTLVRNPLVMAPLIGLLWSTAGLPVPRPAATLFQLLGQAAGPCALFAIGLFLAARPAAGRWAEVGWICVLKLLAQPAITWVLATRVFALDPFWAASAVILAALPTGALVFVVAQTYQTYVERASAAILVSTIASVATVAALMAFYEGCLAVETGSS